MKDPIISVKDLLAECVRKAMLIIVCGIVFAVLLCGFKFYKDSRALNSTVQENEVEFTDDQKLQIAQYVNAVNQWDGLSEYLQESVYINLNPYDVSCVQIQYVVDSASEVDKKDAVYALKAYLTDGGLAEDLSQKDANLDARYFNELIKRESETKTVEVENGIVQLVIYAENTETANQYATWVKESVGNYVSVLNQKDVSCTVEVLDEALLSIVDSKIVENKTLKRMEYTELGKLINDLLPTLSAEQLAEANAILDSKLQSDVPSEKVEVKASISIKYLILGGILGCAIAVVWIAVVYIFTNTIKTSKDVQDMLGITTLGVLTCKKQTIFDVIANKIFYPTECFELDKQKDGVVSKIIFCCNRNAVKNLILVQNNIKDVSVLEDIKAELIKNGIETSVVKNFSVLKDAAMTKDVVFINQINKTKYQDVENEVLFCKNQNINVLGYITVM